MPISTGSSYNLYTGSGTTGPFPFTWKAWDATDLRVVRADLDGVESVLVANVDYTATGIGADAGGSITLATALAAGHRLFVGSSRGNLQEQNYQELNNFSAAAHNDALDKLTRLVQQVREIASRTPQFRATAESAWRDMPLPDPAPSTLLGFDSTGQALARYPVTVMAVPNIDWIGNYEGSLNVAVDTVGSTRKLILVNQGVTLTANVTIPSSMQLWFSEGSLVNLNGFTLTINGSLDAGRYQIFSGDGSVLFGTGAPVAALYPEWWGAKADAGTTDCTAGINAATLAASTSLVPVSLGHGIYETTGRVKIYSDIRLSGVSQFGSIIRNSTSDVVVGTCYANPEIFATQTVFRAVLENFKVVTAVAANTQTAISMNGTEHCRVRDITIQDFQVGIRMERVLEDGTHEGAAASDSIQRSVHCYFNNIDNVTIYDPLYGIFCGNSNWGPNANYFSHLHIRSTKGTWHDYIGVYLSSGNGNFFTHTYVGGGYPKYGVYIGMPSTTNMVQNNMFMGLYLESLANSANSYGLRTVDVGDRVNDVYGIHFDGVPQGGYFYDPYGQIRIYSSEKNSIAGPIGGNTKLDFPGSVAWGGPTNTRVWSVVSGSGKDENGKTVPTGSMAIVNQTSGTMPIQVTKDAADDALLISSAGVGSKQDIETAINFDSGHVDYEMTLAESQGVVYMAYASDADANVILFSTATKEFQALNKTTHAITWKTAAGTGISVAAGKSARLYCDGTNVIRFSADV